MNQEIVERCWQKYVSGDQEAFAMIYEFFRPQLTFFCLGKLKDPELAEQYSSEALIRAYNHENPENINELKPWLFTIAKNLCLTYLRTQQRRSELLKNNLPVQSSFQLADVDLKYSFEEIDFIIRQELNDEEYRLWQYHLAGYVNDEISQKMNMKTKTVANKKSEIRNRLKQAIKKKS